MNGINNQVLTAVLLQSQAKLVDRRRNLQAPLENGTLALQTNVARPFDKSSKVALWLDVLAWK
jgi:hypothetical protein